MKTCSPSRHLTSDQYTRCQFSVWPAVIRGTNILHHRLCTAGHGPGGKTFVLQMLASAAIVLTEGTSTHLQCARQLRFQEEADDFSKGEHFIVVLLTLPPCCLGGERIGQFIMLVRTRRQSNTSHTALRFKTLQDILHTCYIATFGVLTSIVPQGHKNVLPFIECTDSEAPSPNPLANQSWKGPWWGLVFLICNWNTTLLLSCLAKAPARCSKRDPCFSLTIKRSLLGGTDTGEPTSSWDNPYCSFLCVIPTWPYDLTQSLCMPLAPV